MIDALWSDIEAIRERGPLVHNITNYVVMNTTANALLALGASPVMAHAAEEVEEMVGVAAAVGGALVINIGTLSGPWIEAMEQAMRAAKAADVPIVFDPVGAGATSLRTETSQRLLEAVTPTIVRGNASEVMALQGAQAQTRGVDSSEGSEAARESAAELARELGCVVCVSGATDVITDGAEALEVSGGSPMMTRVTGMGCTASALTGAFAAVNPEPLAASAHAMTVMSAAAELAAVKAAGPGTLQLHFYDALYNLSRAQLEGILA